MYFAYAEPYTFAQLTGLVAELAAKNARLPAEEQFFRQEVLCKSISGVAIPLLTITSRINSERRDYAEHSPAMLKDLLSSDSFSSLEPAEAAKFRAECETRVVARRKKVLVVTARVHPGEACGSLVMQGFLRFVTSDDPAAVELRSRMLIKVVPMLNPDGVIIGNYRGCLSGQDLNRQFARPNRQLHPGICAVKKLLRDLRSQGWDIFGYVDMHGHSKKKCVFVHGPYYPLHSERYLRVRILAKLLAERTQMFRYQACKYRKEPDKLTAARFVISREFGVMNSLTLESSFYGFIDRARKTVEFCASFYESMGEHFARSCAEYTRLLEGEVVRRLRRKLEKRRRQQQLIRAKLRRKIRLDSASASTSTDGPQPQAILHAIRGEDAVAPVARQEETAGPQNPNDPTEKKIVRLEECFGNPEICYDVPKQPEHNMADLCEIIKEDMEKEQQQASEDRKDEDSESSESEGDILTGEEQAVVISNILNTIAGFSQGALGTTTTGAGAQNATARPAADEEEEQKGTTKDESESTKRRTVVYTSHHGTRRGEKEPVWWSPPKGSITISRTLERQANKSLALNRGNPMVRSSAVLPKPLRNTECTPFVRQLRLKVLKGAKRNHVVLSRSQGRYRNRELDNSHTESVGRLRPFPQREAGPRQNYFNSRATPNDWASESERTKSFRGLITVTSYNLRNVLALRSRATTSEGTTRMQSAQRPGGEVRRPEERPKSRGPQRVTPRREEKSFCVGKERRCPYSRQTLSDKKSGRVSRRGDVC